MSHSFHNDVYAILFSQKVDNRTDKGQQYRALEIARLIQNRASELQTPHERDQQHELDKLIQNPSDKATVTSITDQAFRSTSPQRSMDQLIHILDVQGIPTFFSRIDRTLLKGIRSFGGYLPGVATPLVRDKMQRETANVILPAEDDHLSQHLQQRQATGLRMNVNLLGEMVLGEQEAARRLDKYLHLLSLKDVEVLSVKISNIYSQITSIGRALIIPILSNRLETLLRESTRHQFLHRDGTKSNKMIYLDMEEYRDMDITSSVFMNTLERDGLKSARAGIALQAYLPDAHLAQRSLTQWAIKRVSNGGNPVTIRVVKGANMEMERVEASLAGFPQAPFKSKIETDANYKRMLQYGLQSEHIHAVHLGVATHNLIDLAYALVLTADADAFHAVQFEMLEGMANHQRRALHEIASNLLLYAPACGQDDFLNAIGYLIRRLDENTGPDNFLRHAFQLQTGSGQWHALEEQFLNSFDLIPKLETLPRRQQESSANQLKWHRPKSWRDFTGQPNTDFSQKYGQDLCTTAIERAGHLINHGPISVTPFIDGDQIRHTKIKIDREDPSRPCTHSVRTHLADISQIQLAVDCCKRDADNWAGISATERTDILLQVANIIESNRTDLMATALIETGKTVAESDPEISEAVDFVRFYAITAENLLSLDGAEASPAGPVVVLSPWNFPIAIPCGGISAALATGNCVILKPAPSASATALRLCECFWEAGISRKTLQLVPCLGSDAGSILATASNIRSVVLTGATKTAEKLLRKNPKLRLFAETGGKNATIVTSLSDRELAIKHIIHSAFGHSGQKCSATSVLILEAEVYDDPHFKSALIDAAASLPVGSAWNLTTSVGPLIDPPGTELAKGLTSLEGDEHWALQPEFDKSNPRLISPAIKWGVRPGSYSHQTEFFGPLLSVLRAKSLPEAIEIANQTPYGLTAGLQSLDDREQEQWKHSVQAGNLYINRGTTGAIVLRQPFGGIRKSSFGPEIKAGGPHYVNLFSDFKNCGFNELRKPEGPLETFFNCLQHEISEWHLTTKMIHQLENALASYEKYFVREYSLQHDHFSLIGQDNLRYYHPIKNIAICVRPKDSPMDTLLRLAAVHLTGYIPQVVISPQTNKETQRTLANSKLFKECDADVSVLNQNEFIKAIQQGRYGRLRFVESSQISESVAIAANETGVSMIDRAISNNGMVELSWYFREQSLSTDYHRYGNLGVRSQDTRSDTL